MRFSAATLLALPLLAVAETQDPLMQAKDTALHYFDLAYSYLPHTNTYSATKAAAAKAKNIDILTLDNWKSTLRSSVTADSAGPEEWWVLLTGGNKTCWGSCEKITEAFTESAELFKSDPTAPHMGLINCDEQPILCHSWATGPPLLYIFEVTPKPEPVTIHMESFNTTTVTPSNFVELHTSNSWKKKPAYEGHYHPFNGAARMVGLDLLTGWGIWSLNVLPNWAFMIILSFVSRTFMGSRRTNPGEAQGRAAAR